MVRSIKTLHSLRRCVKVSVTTELFSMLLGKNSSSFILKGKHLFSLFIFADISSLKLKKNYLSKASLKQWPAEVINSKFGGLKCILAR